MKSQIPTPDFAFPKTVSKEALTDLKLAENSHDAHKALNALIRYGVAETLIDPQNIQQDIKLVEETSETFRNDSLYPLFEALLAKMYSGAYQTDRWVYDQRRMPLTPIPTDITEWSGEIYKNKIKDLIESSVSEGYVKELSLQPIKNYTDLILADGLTSTFYPTLADFVINNAVNLLGTIGDSSYNYENLYKRAISLCSDDSASKMLWLSKAITLDNVDLAYEEANFDDVYFIDDEDPIDEGNQEILQTNEKLKKAYETYKNNPYSGIFLTMMYNRNSDLDEKKSFIATAEEYNKRLPDNVFKNILINDINNIKSENVRISLPQQIAVGVTTNITVNNSNAKNYDIEVYQLSDVYKNFNNREINTFLKSHKPTQTISLNCDSIVPFYQNTSATFTLPKAGTYLIRPNLKDVASQDENSYQIVKAYDLIPVVVKKDGSISIIVTDAATGKPRKDIYVNLIDRKGRIKNVGSTDANGIVETTSKDTENYPNLSLSVGGQNYNFEDIWLRTYSNGRNNYNDVQATINTDRAIYHPGDEVNVLAVFYTNDKEADKTKIEQSLLKGEKVRLTLINANYQDVDTTSVTTDDYGRATVKFTIPTDGLSGRFQIRAEHNADYCGHKTFMVSDYRMPEFEVTIATPECDVPNQGEVTIKGRAITYSGMPVSNAKIDLTLNRSGFRWWYHDFTEIYTAQLETDLEGNFSVVLNSDALGDNPQKYVFEATFDITSASGYTVTESTIFSLTKKYNITLNIPNSNINGEKPFTPAVKVYDVKGDEVSIPLKWQIKKDTTIVARGDYDGNIDLSTIKPDIYLFTISASDQQLAEAQSLSITVYNKSMGIVPGDTALWCQQDTYQVEGNNGKIDIEIASGGDLTSLYYFVDDGYDKFPIKVKALKYGYHTLSIDFDSENDQARVTLICVRNCKVYTENINIIRKKDSGLKIVGESFRDNLVPSSKETWKLKITNADGSPVESALALDMYNKALESLASQNFKMYFNKPYFQNFADLSFIYYRETYTSVSQKIKSLPTPTIGEPEFNLYGYDFIGMTKVYGMRMSKAMMSSDDGLMMSAPMAVENSVMYDSVKEESIESVEDEEVDLAGGPTPDAGESTPETEFEYRDTDVPLAIWAPTLITDAEGNVVYTFTVPNANTTWRLQAIAWTKDMEVGALMRDFVASKPIMVQPNLPRFLRSGDTATVLATVMNKSEEASTVTTTVEVFNPIDGKVLDTRVYTDTVGAMQSITVSMDIATTSGLNAVGYRVKATNGEYTDGEQAVIRVLSSEAQLIETTPFYLNPGEKSYSVALPDAKDARISLTFCENPVWTIVSALPGLRTDIEKYANSAAAALFSAKIAKGILNDNPGIANALKQWIDNPDDSALVSMLEKNEDLKIAVLNATPWVLAAQSDTERMVNLAMLFNEIEISLSTKQALKILSDLQMADGGWAWSDWCKESSFWVTGNVLDMLGTLIQCGWLESDTEISNMIKDAVRYFDTKVEDTNMVYCITRAKFPYIPVSANGNAVIAKTIKEITKNWKKYSDPGTKAIAAEVLYLNGEKQMAHTLMSSISEFGVWTPNQGLRFPSVDALYEYAILLEAYATIEPQSREVDGLRQQLIVRKQANNWGSAVVTTEVVQSILTSGSKWTTTDTKAEVKVGETIIQPQGAVEHATGSLRADLSEYAGDTLTISTNGVGPAYGAIYSQFSQKMEDVMASSCDDLSIEKQMFVRRGDAWEMAGELKVGDRVKVQLTIHSKRNMQYVSIIDERPAAFEPVEQLPGWLWSEGVGFYRENRDAETDMHVVYMSPGTYLLTYEMNVNVAGTFASGVATIQSQYAPELSAHSSGTIVTVK